MDEVEYVAEIEYIVYNNILITIYTVRTCNRYISFMKISEKIYFFFS